MLYEMLKQAVLSVSLEERVVLVVITLFVLMVINWVVYARSQNYPHGQL